MIPDRAVGAMEYEQKTTPKLSNGTIFIDLERPVTHVLRSRQ